MPVVSERADLMRPALAKRNRPRPLAVTVFGAVDRPGVALTSEGLLNRRLCGLRVADQGRRPNLNESSGTDASKDPRADPDTGGGAILLTWECSGETGVRQFGRRRGW
jgi:hypothetical protein